jgi:hypothetical protein
MRSTHLQNSQGETKKKDFRYDRKAVIRDICRRCGAVLVFRRTIASGRTSLKAGQTEMVVLKLSVLGTYSATSPYDCHKFAGADRRNESSLRTRTDGEHHS